MAKSHKMSDGHPGGNVAGGENLDGLVLKLETYQGGKGQTIQERVVIAGEPPEGFHRFIGQTSCEIKVNTPQGPQTKMDTFRFPIEGVKDILAAFEHYDVFCKRGAAVHQESLQKRVDAASKPQLQVATPAEQAALGKSGMRDLRPPGIVTG